MSTPLRSKHLSNLNIIYRGLDTLNRVWGYSYNYDKESPKTVWVIIKAPIETRDLETTWNRAWWACYRITIGGTPKCR